MRKHALSIYHYLSIISKFTGKSLLQVCPNLLHTEPNTMHRPRWWEHEQIFGLGRRLDLRANYAVHLFYRFHNADYDPRSIRALDSPLGAIFRRVYYGNETLLETRSSTPSTIAAASRVTPLKKKG